MFELDEKQEKLFHDWNCEHIKTCKLTQSPTGTGAIGGRLSYCFIPTGLGVITKVKCACGEEVDLTEYTDW